MTTKIKVVIATDQTNKKRSDSVDLFSQQIWCWGRDILRTEGNWLIHYGFDGIYPPAEKAGCKNIYSLSLSSSKNLILRGFGAIFSDQDFGTIFVPRTDFRPKYTRSGELETPPWEVGDLSDLKFPVGPEIEHSSSMLIEFVDWIIKYENEVQNQLGIKYRANTLSEWDNGKRRVIPPEEIIPMWVKIKNGLQESIAVPITTSDEQSC